MLFTTGKYLPAPAVNVNLATVAVVPSLTLPTHCVLLEPPTPSLICVRVISVTVDQVGVTLDFVTISVLIPTALSSPSE